MQRTLAAKPGNGDGRRVLPPVLQRELLVRARRGSTTWIRLGIFLLALMLVALLLIPAMLMGSMTGMGMASGRIIFEPLRYLLLVYALFEGARSVASAIPDERRDGTLGLLFLTNLRSWDVLLGKTAGGALTSIYGALAVAPLFAIPVLLGGVTGGEVFRTLISLFAALLLALGCGTLASALCRTTLPALLTGIGLAAIMATGPLVLVSLLNAASATITETHWSGWLSPFISLNLGSDAAYYADAGPFWYATLAQLAMAGVFAIAGSMRLATNWRDGSLFTSTGDAVRRKAERARPKEGLRREIKLPLWLAGMGTTPLARTLGGRIKLARWIGVLMLLQLIIVAPGVLNAFLGGMGGAMVSSVLGIPVFFAFMASQLILIYMACRVFADARHTGEMEILMTSPVTDRELVLTLWHMLRNGLLWVYAITVTGAAIALFGEGGSGMFGNTAADPLWARLVVLATTLTAEALYMAGVVWAGMWFGLKSTRTSGATIKTFVMLVIVTGLLKWLVFVIVQTAIMFNLMKGPTPPAGLQSLMGALPHLIGGGLSVAWILWARRLLFSKFRQVVTETETRSLWIQRLETRLIPPPLPVQPPSITGSIPPVVPNH